MYFIGYDIGSSSVKATLLEGETNALVTSAQHPSEEMCLLLEEYALVGIIAWLNTQVKQSALVIIGAAVYYIDF